LQLLIADYRKTLIQANSNYGQTFVTPFYQELKGLFDIQMNTTLGEEVEPPEGMWEYPSKMKMLFEDGELMKNILGLGFVPYASQLIFELHYQPSTK
jgi:hypothetical protein